MTANKFAQLCAEHSVSLEIALEKEAIKQALRANDDSLVEALLKELF